MWHHVSVIEQTALLSVAPPDFLLSLLPSSVSLLSPPPCSAHPPPLVLFSFSFVFTNNKGTPESRLETSFLSLAIKKDTTPQPLHTHTHTRAHMHTDTCSQCAHSFRLTLYFLLQRRPCVHHEALCRTSLLLSSYTLTCSYFSFWGPL